MSKAPDTTWKEHWKDMPEFVQEKQRPFRQLIIRFDTQEAYDDFARRIEQPLTEKTKSIWHPRLQRNVHETKRYIDATEG